MKHLINDTKSNCVTNSFFFFFCWLKSKCFSKHNCKYGRNVHSAIWRYLKIHNFAKKNCQQCTYLRKLVHFHNWQLATGRQTGFSFPFEFDNREINRQTVICAPALTAQNKTIIQNCTEGHVQHTLSLLTLTGELCKFAFQMPKLKNSGFT